MEVRIRNIDPAIVSVIDEYAKENNESRNIYLTRLIQWDAKRKLMNRVDEELNEKIKPLISFMEIISNRFEEMELEIQKVKALLIYLGGLDQEEVDQLLEKVIIRMEDSYDK